MNKDNLGNKNDPYFLLMFILTMLIDFYCNIMLSFSFEITNRITCFSHFELCFKMKAEHIFRF